MVEIKATPIKVNVTNFKTNFNDNKVGTIQSVLSGIAAGLIDIPKGAFSLGASLMDIGFGTDNASQIESFLMILLRLMKKQRQQQLVKLHVLLQI